MLAQLGVSDSPERIYNAILTDESDPLIETVVAMLQQRPLVAAASVCGNGVLESSEECDDSNRRSGDGCSESCLLEIGICGDGILQRLLGEQCEQSTHNPTLPYSCLRCRFVSRSCGDGHTDLGEECDRGNLNSTSPNANCRPDCSLGRCGDSILDSFEQCDDGNRIGNDGCDAYCVKEISVLVQKDAILETGYENQVTPQQPNSLAAHQFAQFPFAPYQMPYQQLPYAQLQPFMQQLPQTTESGPAALFAIATGASAGFAWVRKKRKR